MSRRNYWHISGWAAALLAPLAIPAAIIAAHFGKQRKADLSAAEVAKYLRDFIDGTGGDWDWDDFTSIPVANPALDHIRQEADAVCLPLTTHGESELRALLKRVETM